MLYEEYICLISDLRYDEPHFIMFVDWLIVYFQDVTAKIISFCQQGPRAICILSANGMVSNATLRQSDSSGGTLTYEVHSKYLSLCINSHFIF